MKKIVSYLGFAQKSNNFIKGQKALKTAEKKIFLIMVCVTATQNLKDLAKNLKEKFKCAVIYLNTNLKELTNLNDIKIIGITDENLANAIIKEYTSNCENNNKEN